MGEENKSLEQLKVEAEQAKQAYEILQNTIKQKEVEEAELKKAKLESEKEARYKEIEEAENKLAELIKAYLEDYGTLKLNQSGKSSNTWPPFWSHLFF